MNVDKESEDTKAAPKFALFLQLIAKTLFVIAYIRKADVCKLLDIIAT